MTIDATDSQRDSGGPDELDTVDDQAESRSDRRSRRSRRGRGWLIAALVVVVLAVAGYFVWTLVLADRLNPSPAASAEPSASSNPGAIIATADQLPTLAAAQGHTVYWAGPLAGKQYELTLSGTSFYVRYLPPSEAAGSTNPFLTVATYVKTGAYADLVSGAKAEGAQSDKLEGGALVMSTSKTATSAYFAFDGSDLLMEVFDPEPGRAYELISTGAIQPIK